MTPNEVAEVLNISPKTVYEWAKLGKLPSTKLFSEIRFKKEVIDDIYNNGLQKTEVGYDIPKLKPKKLKKTEVKLGSWERRKLAKLPV